MRAGDGVIRTLTRDLPSVQRPDASDTRRLGAILPHYCSKGWDSSVSAMFIHERSVRKM